MGNEEERALEEQLEDQLHDQRDSFAAIEDALTSDPCNPELVSIREELVQAIKDAEEGLFHLKRARLLQEADAVLCASGHTAGEVKAEPLDPADDVDDVEPEPFVEQSFSVGSKCRFRHTDGRWYNGQIIGLGEGDSGVARIAFLTPTNENKLMCRFFLQQRCRFSNSCRLSHGVDVPLSSLKSYVQTQWQQSMVGSTIWAASGNKHDIWREAELESWDDKSSVGKVVFRDNGSSEELGVDSIAISEYAQVTDEEDEESESSTEDYGSSDNEEETPQGLGFLDGSQLKGIQTETALFATWENHTRGIASKMMANMGYRQGMGLGVSGQGMLDPILVKKRPAKQSLDYAVESHETGEDNVKNRHKKRSRGGKRKRDKKHAEAARAAKEEEEPRPDVFSLINNQLATHHETINGGGSAKKKQIKGQEEGKKVDRRALVAYEDGIKDLKLQVEKLEEMVKRNRNEKVVYEAAMRKLNETRKALTEAEASHASASSAVVSREKEKKWLKF